MVIYLRRRLRKHTYSLIVLLGCVGVLSGVFLGLDRGLFIGGAVVLALLSSFILYRRATTLVLTSGDAVALHRDEGFVGELMGTLGAVVFVVDGEGMIVGAGLAQSRLLGHEVTTLLGRHIAEVVHSDDQVLVEAALRAGYRPGLTSRGPEFRIKRYDGLWVPFSTSWKHQVDERGNTRYIIIAQDVSVPRWVEQRSQDQLRRYEALLSVQNQVGECVLIAENNVIRFANDALAVLSGYRLGELFALPSFLLLWSADEQAKIEAHMRSHASGMRSDSRFETLLIRKDWQAVPIEAAVELLNIDGRTQVVMIARDITERKAAEKELAEVRLQSLIQNSTDIITVVDASGVVRYQSPSAELVLGFHPSILVGANVFSLVHVDDVPIVQRLFTNLIQHTPEGRRVEMRVRHADGRWRYLEAIGTNMLDDPEVAGVVINARDVTERKRFEHALEFQAFHDSLTGLPNRSLFIDRLEQVLARYRRSPGVLAVLFLDLDRFKVINDSLGHDAGDQLLKVVAERLSDCVRQEDTVARLGGDEFTVLLEGVSGVTDAIHTAERIAAKIQVPLCVHGHDIVVSASIGIALSDGQQQDARELLRDADTAMYRAKRNGQLAYEIFDPSMNAVARQRLALESDLRHALARTEFSVYYQPIVELDSGEVLKVEALVRWNHPQHGLLSPGEFIPLAEETGLIIPLGRWVLEEACRQVKAWQERYQRCAGLVVSVNLSARQFQSLSLATDVIGVLRKTGLSPHCLQLEITESVLMDDVATTMNTLRGLKQIGIQLAIDDFGTGHSSLSYLRRFPIDILKIDRSFVERLGEDPEAEAIADLVVKLAGALQIASTAEGIETTMQLLKLRALGCAQGQGYYFSEPLAPALLEPLLKEGIAATMPPLWMDARHRSQEQPPQMQAATSSQHREQRAAL